MFSLKYLTFDPDEYSSLWIVIRGLETVSFILLTIPLEKQTLMFFSTE